MIYFILLIIINITNEYKMRMHIYIDLFMRVYSLEYIYIYIDVI
jgi:hypothetical protein